MRPGRWLSAEQVQGTGLGWHPSGNDEWLACFAGGRQGSQAPDRYPRSKHAGLLVKPKRQWHVEVRDVHGPGGAMLPKAAQNGYAVSIPCT